MPQITQPEGSKASKPADDQPKNEPVTLPPNVSIYTGTSGDQLLNAKLFTRLETTVQDSNQLALALGSDCAPFCIQHQNSAVIFDDEQDSHHEHFRQVCLKLKDHDIGLQYARCVFDASTSLQAGFQFDRLNAKSILVINLQIQDDESEDDDDDDDDEDDEDANLAALGLPVGGTLSLNTAQGDGTLSGSN